MHVSGKNRLTYQYEARGTGASRVEKFERTSKLRFELLPPEVVDHVIHHALADGLTYQDVAAVSLHLHDAAADHARHALAAATASRGGRYPQLTTYEWRHYSAIVDWLIADEKEALDRSDDSSSSVDLPLRSTSLLAAVNARGPESFRGLLHAWAEQEKKVSPADSVSNFVRVMQDTYERDYRELHIEGNLRSIPACIGYLSNLTILSVVGTPLSSLPESINHLTNLEWLRFCNCSLERWPDGIENLISLTYLNLCINPLVEWPRNIEQLPRLQHLNISYDARLPIPSDVLLQMQSLKGLGVDEQQINTWRSTLLRFQNRDKNIYLNSRVGDGLLSSPCRI